MQSFSSALTTFRRAPLLSALSITTIAFSLFAFGLFGLVAINIRQALDQVEERVEVRAFLTDSTDIESDSSAMCGVPPVPRNSPSMMRRFSVSGVSRQSGRRDTASQVVVSRLASGESFVVKS